MSAHKKAGKVATLPASDTAFHDINSSAQDPLIGWFSLASNVKPSRDRQQKKSCIRKGGR